MDGYSAAAMRAKGATQEWADHLADLKRQAAIASGALAVVDFGEGEGMTFDESPKAKAARRRAAEERKRRRQKEADDAEQRHETAKAEAMQALADRARVHSALERVAKEHRERMLASYAAGEMDPEAGRKLLERLGAEVFEGPPAPDKMEALARLDALNREIERGGKNWSEFKDALTNFAVPAGLAALGDAVTTLSESLATMAFTGEMAFADLAAAMIRIVAQLAQTVGQYFFLVGVATANPIMAGAGLGLLALAGVGSAVASEVEGDGGRDRRRGGRGGGSAGAFAGAGEAAARANEGAGGPTSITVYTGRTVDTRQEIARDIGDLLRETGQARVLRDGSRFRRS